MNMKMRSLSKGLGMTAAILGSFMLADTADAKTRLPINRSNLSNNGYTGSAVSTFGRNISTTRSAVRNYPSASFGRSISFNQPAPTSGYATATARPVAPTRPIATTAPRYAPQYRVTRSPGVIYTPNVVRTARTYRSDTPVYQGSIRR